MPMWLVALMIIGGIIGIFLLVALMCYGFIGILMIKDRRIKK